VWSDLGLVFASTIGTQLEPRNVNRRFEQLRATKASGFRVGGISDMVLALQGVRATKLTDA
jgi:hypothetical protein